MIRPLMRRARARSDGWLWLAIYALAALGLLLVYSASLGAPPHPSITPEAARHAVFLAAGVVTMLVLARSDYRFLRRVAPLVYVGAIGLLVLVLAIGSPEFGAQRWLSLGPLTVQPAEFAKIALVAALALYAAGRQPALPSVLMTMAICGPVIGLVVLQPDMGTIVVFAAIWAAMVLIWGVGWRLLGGLFAVALSAGPLAFAILVPDYQRERLAVFLDPTRDPLGSGFNLRQAEVALGSGGLSGTGLFGGAESHMSNVAARSSDFVFALAGEELGTLGGLVILVLLAIVVWRGFEAARHAPDDFGRLLAVGLTTLILAQAYVNVAVNLRLFPATGLPLPFVSAGGSSLLAMFIAAGLLQSIASHRPATPREQWSGQRWL